MQGIQLNGLSAAVLALVVMVEAGVATAGQPSHFPSPHHPWTTREYVDFYFAHYNGNRALPHLTFRRDGAAVRSHRPPGECASRE